MNGSNRLCLHWNGSMLIPQHLHLLQLLRTCQSTFRYNFHCCTNPNNIFVAKALFIDHATCNSYMYMYMYVPCRYKVSHMFPLHHCLHISWQARALFHPQCSTRCTAGRWALNRITHHHQHICKRACACV